MEQRLFLLFLATMKGAALGAEASCRPDCSRKGPYQRVPDPTDCHRYHICRRDGRPTAGAVSCGPGRRFDPASGGCVPDGGCGPLCGRAPCRYACGSAAVRDDLVADPYDCSAFYLCRPEGVGVGGRFGPFFCPAERPFFNGRLCGGEEDACCRHACVPFCHEGGVQIADPFDCRSFYVCLEAGPAPDLRFECRPREAMDAEAGHCLPGPSSCRPPCTALDLDELLAYEEIAGGDDDGLEELAQQVERERHDASGPRPRKGRLLRPWGSEPSPRATLDP